MRECVNLQWQVCAWQRTPLHKLCLYLLAKLFAIRLTCHIERFESRDREARRICVNMLHKHWIHLFCRLRTCFGRSSLRQNTTKYTRVLCGEAVAVRTLIVQTLDNLFAKHTMSSAFGILNRDKSV